MSCEVQHGSMEEESNGPTLQGSPTVITSNEPASVFVEQGTFLPVQKSAAAKVIGWFLIVFGVLGILGSPLTFLSETTDFEGNPVTLPTMYFVVAILTALVGNGLQILGGYKMTNYEKKGVWIVFAALGINWLGTTLSQFIVGQSMDSEIGGALVGGMSGICGLLGTAICGLIVAIPLMMSDGGLE